MTRRYLPFRLFLNNVTTSVHVTRPVDFRLCQKIAVKSQSAPVGVFWFRFFFLKACVYYTFMNNEILAMFVGFVRVLRPLCCREFSTFPRFRCQIVHKIAVEDSLVILRAPSAKFLSRLFCVRVSVCVCGWIIIWHGIVGDYLLCEANISLKAHFLDHCFKKRYGTPRTLRHLKDRQFACPFADIISFKHISLIQKGSYKYHFQKVIARFHDCASCSNSGA